MRPARPARIALAVATLGAVGCARPPEPGVRIDAASIRRVAFCKDSGIGDIRSIVAPLPGSDEIWIGGQTGSLRVARDGTQLGRTRFAKQLWTPRPIDVDDDGRWETMDCGGSWGDVGLLDHDGAVRWSFPPGSDDLAAPDAMDAGPLGDSGELRFVVGMNGGDGVFLLDVEGQTVGRLEGTNVFSVAVADLDDDGEPEMLLTDGREDEIRVRHRDGRILRRLEVDFGFFSLIEWPAGSAPRLLGIDDERVQIFDPLVEPAGRVVEEFELPDSGFSDGEGVLIRPSPGSAPYLAVARTIRATWRRSAVYVFDAERRLVYHEVFPFSHIGLGVLSVEDASPGAGATERLLVGAGDTVWSLSLPPLTAPATDGR